MYLKSLTLRGFKSFASATTLAFEPGLTVIVGPNGSGKSNVVDALSWVMGEQGVKPLRGSKMEDVIFAGTTGRAPLGRAEVTLTIDNTDQLLPIDYTEVTISRTLFRSGGSEYAINGRSCRLLDVQELLSDTGMGNQMHVVVGQGQLDAILAATPEAHRSFIEEAAGVLKHRRRKEKALRKLDATQANLVRLTDLIAEIRRQLKPLGRQAEVARRAAVVQASLRDAKARLLADDYAAAQAALDEDLADEAATLARRTACEQALAQARAAEEAAERAAAAALPALSAAQEVWYGLATLRERAATTASIAAERVRSAVQATAAPTGGADPDALEAEAEQTRAQEQVRRAEVAVAEAALAGATRAREQAEAAAGAAAAAYAAAVRAAADAREQAAKLDGRAGALRSRLQAGTEEAGRLAARAEEARARAGAAQAQYAGLEGEIVAQDASQAGLNEAFDGAEAAWLAAQAGVADQRERVRRLEQERTGVAARLEALELSLASTDASGALAERPLAGVVGALSELISVTPGWQAAIAAALGRAAEALVVGDVGDGAAILALLRAEDLPRLHLLIGGAAPAATGPAPAGLTWAEAVVSADARVGGALRRLLAGTVVVEDLDAAREAVRSHPALTAVTRDGDVLSAWRAEGGGAAGASRLEVRAAADEARERLEQTEHALEQTRFALSSAEAAERAAAQVRAAALARLDESDAALAALTGQAGLLAQTVKASNAEAERIAESIRATGQARAADEAALAELEQRRAQAAAGEAVAEPDPGPRDELAARERGARQAETDARLALRTAEERLAAVAGRADALIRAAAAERARQAAAAARAERARRQAAAARAVQRGAEWLVGRIEAAHALASAAREAAERERLAAEAHLASARATTRARADELNVLVEGAHRGEVARIEQRLRLETLTDRALSEFGLDVETLVDEYGPDQMVPALLTPQQEAAGLTPPEPVPYVREEQVARLRQAERDLEVLGRVNPVALEEFDAMNERHTYLAAQLDDLKRTRADLLGIVEEVDARVQDVFATAFTDVSRAFADVFARLFPGGEGRLVLTDPDDMLATGVEVEARPAGKKVKRLSLLSGGERSLVAVAFLLSLFIARPSPFYILDEVEAALDDINLARLLEVYADLRRTSQLLVITHQKRTMEMADTIYGITMRADGISTVVSQRLVDA